METNDPKIVRLWLTMGLALEVCGLNHSPDQWFDVDNIDWIERVLAGDDCDIKQFTYRIKSDGNK